MQPNICEVTEKCSTDVMLTQNSINQYLINRVRTAKCGVDEY